MHNKHVNNASNLVKHGYEATVKARALARAGACNNLNGHILEVMGADKTNLNPCNWARGVRETLSKSATDKVADSVVRQGGKVIAKVQYKDCSHSIGDVVRRVKSGQYQGTTLKGTTETAKVFNRYAAKHGMPVRMQDTGISQNTTKSLARSCGACKQVPLSTATGWAAKSGGIWGGAISGGISAVSNIAAVCNGEKDGWEAAGCIAKDTAGGALSGAGAAAAATVTGSAVAAGIAGTAIAGTALGVACTVGAPIAAAVAVGAAITGIWNSIFD